MTTHTPSLQEQMDAWAKKLDARFKRAEGGGGCANCGCPDAQYVRVFKSEIERVAVFASALEQIVDEARGSTLYCNWCGTTPDRNHRGDCPAAIALDALEVKKYPK